jgi:hypothetical protein
MEMLCSLLPGLWLFIIADQALLYHLIPQQAIRETDRAGNVTLYYRGDVEARKRQ